MKKLLLLNLKLWYSYEFLIYIYSIDFFFWFINEIIQIHNTMKSNTNIGDNGAKFIEEGVKELTNL